MIGICLVVLALCLLGNACASIFTTTCQIGDIAGTVICAAEIEGAYYLFLPSCARTLPLVIDADADCELTMESPTGQTLPVEAGKAFFLSPLLADSGGGDCTLTFRKESGNTDSITVMISDRIRSLFLTSADPDNEGRAWLEGCENHERSTTGSAVLLRADGSAAYSGALQQLRGRGNSTWIETPEGGSAVEGDYKRPYQIKLASKADLLDTGDPDEANKCWVLLANFFDGTMLRNRISLNLALELGLSETSHCQPVDLYYDGEYRGLYLLAEKVEVGDGRVEIADYEKILETVNALAGSWDTLEPVESVNRYGDTICASAGIDDLGETGLGGYLLEIDSYDVSLEPAHFTLQNGFTFVLESPQYASEAMVRHVSELFADIFTTVENGGIHPDSGVQWDSYFDIDSLLPYYWVNEWAKNIDTWRYSSTYFTLPAQGAKIRMGPVWDFDFAFYSAIQEDGSLSDATGFVEWEYDKSLGYGFLQIPEFQRLAARYFDDVLEPAVTQILLGDEQAHGEYLHSLAWYWQDEAASRRMNDVLWNPVTAFDRYSAPTYEENYANLRSYMEERTAWLRQAISGWRED